MSWPAWLASVASALFFLALLISTELARDDSFGAGREPRDVRGLLVLVIVTALSVHRVWMTRPTRALMIVTPDTVEFTSGLARRRAPRADVLGFSVRRRQLRLRAHLVLRSGHSYLLVGRPASMSWRGVADLLGLPHDMMRSYPVDPAVTAAFDDELNSLMGTRYPNVSVRLTDGKLSRHSVQEALERAGLGHVVADYMRDTEEALSDEEELICITTEWVTVICDD